MYVVQHTRQVTQGARRQEAIKLLSEHARMLKRQAPVTQVLGMLPFSGESRDQDTIVQMFFESREAWGKWADSISQEVKDWAQKLRVATDEGLISGHQVTFFAATDFPEDDG